MENPTISRDPRVVSGQSCHLWENERVNAIPQPDPQTAKPSTQRSLLVDVVRGVAISLVAFGHTNQGEGNRGWWGTSQVGNQLDHFIYAFHMPAFFFVSGIFLTSSVAKRGPVRFIRTKVAQLLWPYLLWSVLQYGSMFPLQRFMKLPVPSPGVFLHGLLIGDTLWFLPAVFFCLLLGMLLRKVSMPLVFILAAAVSLIPGHTHLVFVDATMAHFPFLAAGMWLARGYERIERISLPVAAAGAVALGGVLYLVTSGPLADSRWLTLPLGLLGTAMLFLLARCFRRDAFARTMAWVGEASFGVYLMSPYGQGTGRALLLHLGITEPYIQLLIPSLCAILIPAWIYQHRVRLKVDWLFTWPSRSPGA